MFASKTTRGFYDAAIHGDNMPADVVEVTVEEHAELLEGQTQGKVINWDNDGYPFLANPPAPTSEQIQKQINSQARAYLASTDWYVIRWQENATPIPESVSTARDEARAQVVEYEGT